MSGHMRRDVGRSRARHKAFLVVVLVGRHRQAAFARPSIKHCQCGIDFCRTAGLGGFAIDHQRMPVVGENMADIAQTTGLARGFLVEPGIGIGLAFVRVRAALVALEVRRPCGRFVVSSRSAWACSLCSS